MRNLFTSFYYMLVFLLVLSSYIVSANNVIYIVVDGVSRNTFYTLINGKKLPHYQTLIDRGNYRNLSIPPAFLDNDKSSHLLYTGNTLNSIKSKPLLTRIKETYPDLPIACILSTPISKKWEPSLIHSLDMLITSTNSPVLDYKTSTEIAHQAITFIEESPSRFFLFINFTNVNYFGWRYREGTDLYSKAIKKTDTALGLIIDALRKKNQFETTEFLITTTHGYHKNLPLPIAEGWILGTKKALRKGSLYDIYPSLIDLLDLKIPMDSFSGQSLYQN